MKIHPDGTIEGSPEELAAFRHIDAAMTAKDVARARVSQRKPKKAVTQTKSEDVLEMVKSLDSGEGVSAADLAVHMGIDRKAAYQKLYGMKTLGRLDVSEGKFRMVAP
jgi:hypothetical protein